jgi:hypothetical protein
LREVVAVIPDDPNALLKRRLTAEALTESGYPTKSATLATKATRGGGPPYQVYGAVALYRWGDALDWARSRLSPPRSNTSESDAAEAANAAEARPITPQLSSDDAGARDDAGDKPVRGSPTPLRSKRSRPPKVSADFRRHLDELTRAAPRKATP